MEKRALDYRNIRVITPYGLLELRTPETISEPNRHTRLHFTALVDQDKKTGA